MEQVVAMEIEEEWKSGGGASITENLRGGGLDDAPPGGPSRQECKRQRDAGLFNQESAFHFRQSRAGDDEEAEGDDEKEGSRVLPGPQEKMELYRSFQVAVGAHDWTRAENLIPLADTQRLNDALCIALDSVWFLSAQSELQGATRLIEKLVESGADDFTRAALRTSFLASCVSACRSRTMNLADTVAVMGQRLRERLQECNGDETLKAEAAAKVQRFTEWALKCIGSHSKAQCHGDGGDDKFFQSSRDESQHQLRAFKRFLELAGNRLTGKDYTEAFDAACFPLTLFSNAIDSGWATGIAASAIQGLLGMLVEGGADNVNQCFLEASRFGSTELVRILLQIARRNGIEVDVDLALGFACHYCKIGTMECLAEDGNAAAFLGPLLRAADQGCTQVVQWFVRRGCTDTELCLALTAAASSSRLEMAAYLLDRIPAPVLQTLALEILKAAGERSSGSLQGIAFLLQSDFLRDPTRTYKIADGLSRADDNDDSVSPELRCFFHDHWSEAAFSCGRRMGAADYVNVMRAVRRGTSPLRLQELPLELRVAIAYLPLYRECVAAGGTILSQRLRGQLVEAVERLYGDCFMAGVSWDNVTHWSKTTLLKLLVAKLPFFLVHDL